MIDNGIIGIPLTVHIKLHKAANEKDLPAEKHSWHVNPEIAGAGHFFDLASHQLDYLDFLFGPIIDVHGIAVNQAGYYKAEDTVTGTFRFGNGVVGTGSWCFVTDRSSFADTIEITGTLGKIILPCFTHQDMEMITAQGSMKFPVQNPENIQFHLIQQVVDELRGVGESPSTGKNCRPNQRSTGRNGEKLLRVQKRRQQTNKRLLQNNLNHKEHEGSQRKIKTSWTL